MEIRGSPGHVKGVMCSRLSLRGGPMGRARGEGFGGEMSRACPSLFSCPLLATSSGGGEVVEIKLNRVPHSSPKLKWWERRASGERSGIAQVMRIGIEGGKRRREWMEGEQPAAARRRRKRTGRGTECQAKGMGTCRARRGEAEWLGSCAT
ncbi:unnamed protein product [Pleuronectes platessa]|uniref:Uncharacterized protein n=1 Tax=Pleuronectes platessa TaxID=8262 RepID=A0A9N7V145_PLEPL|nr:unnamed protein product [Pleuronectes platessa]